MTLTTSLQVFHDGEDRGFVDVTGDVTVSADGSEYEVTLLEFRDGDRWTDPDAFSAAQQEDAKDALVELARDMERAQSSLSLLVDVGSYRGGAL